MADGQLPGVWFRETEFDRGLTGACGPNSLDMAHRWSKQSPLDNLNHTYDTVQFLQGRGILPANSNGISDPAQILAGAQAYGLPLGHFQNWTQPWSGWQATLDAELAAGHAAILFVHNGQAFNDERTGKGENAVHLQNHVIVIGGKFGGGWSAFAGKNLDAGYWALDGDNFDVGNVFQYYSAGVVGAAQPSALIGVASSVAAPTGGGGGGSHVGVPTGWSDDGTTLKSPNGVAVVLGFRDWILGHAWDPNDWPLETEKEHDPLELSNTALGAGQRQVFRITTLEYTVKTGVFVAWVGQELLWTESLLSQASGSSALQQQLDAANAEIAALKAQLATAATDVGAVQTAVAKVATDVAPK